MSLRIAVILSCAFILATLLSSGSCILSPRERLINKLGTTDTYEGKMANQLNSYWISPNGKRITYIYNDHVERKPGQMPVNPKSSIVVDGSREKQYDYVQWFTFSFDSKRYDSDVGNNVFDTNILHSPSLVEFNMILAKRYTTGNLT